MPEENNQNNIYIIDINAPEIQLIVTLLNETTLKGNIAHQFVNMYDNMVVAYKRIANTENSNQATQVDVRLSENQIKILDQVLKRSTVQAEHVELFMSVRNKVLNSRVENPDNNSKKDSENKTESKPKQKSKVKQKAKAKSKSKKSSKK